MDPVLAGCMMVAIFGVFMLMIALDKWLDRYPAVDEAIERFLQKIGG